jgi:hypothetical protein
MRDEQVEHLTTAAILAGMKLSKELMQAEG